ncbi:MAG TPA: mechanosensitive ion channel family protein [Pyrinomonadaceae bacterium]|jgi:small-conductance mechanosensitive channel|nr:mechanosensitive ion channel family protein [Pyrinomonadaceae bacterium]
MTPDISIAWTKIEQLLTGLIAILPNLGLALLLFGVLFAGSRWVKFFIIKISSARGYDNLGLVLGRLSHWALVSVSLLAALTIVLPSFHARDLIQILGIGSVAIGFAFRDILQNFLAGILILLAQPFRLGEEIAVEGYEGVVEEIQARATLIRTSDGFLIVIPNATIYTKTVTILNSYAARRTAVEFEVGLRDDPELIRRLVKQAIGRDREVLKVPEPDAILLGFGRGCLSVSARWWTDSKHTDQVVVRDRVVAYIKNTLVENGIDLSYPTHQVLFHDQTEEVDGDRARQRAGWTAGSNGIPRPRKLADAVVDLAQAACVKVQAAK